MGAVGSKKSAFFFKIRVPESVEMTTQFLLHGFRLYSIWLKTLFFVGIHQNLWVETNENDTGSFAPRTPRDFLKALTSPRHYAWKKVTSTNLVGVLPMHVSLLFSMNCIFD